MPANKENSRSFSLSLATSKQRVQKLAMWEYKNAESIDHLLLDSVNLINRKLKQVSSTESAKEVAVPNIDQLKEKNMRFKSIIRREITRTRSQLRQQKAQNSILLKQASQTNQEIIERRKKNEYLIKKTRREAVRNSLKQSQERIAQFHIEKQNDLKRIREEEEAAERVRRQKLKEEFEAVQAKENELSKRESETRNVLRKFKFAMNRLGKMHGPKFLQITKKIADDLDTTEHGDVDVAERILNEIITYQSNLSKNEGSISHQD